MKKKLYQNVVALHLQEHSSIYVFVIVLFLMGIIFGAVVVNSLSITQKEDLYYYLMQFFGQMTNEKIIASSDIFLQSFFHNIKYTGLMWILGISIVGLPITLVLLFIKGMVVGFTVGFLVNQMGWQGFILSFVSILPQNLIVIPIFIIVAVLSIAFSLTMIKRQFMKKITQPIFPLLKRYVLTFVMASLVLLVAAAIEAYLSPQLMKMLVL